MKVTLINNTDEITNIPLSITECSNRFQLYIYMLNKYLTQRNIQVYTSNKLTDSLDDHHIIIVGDDKVQNCKSYKTINRINVSNVHHYKNEDMLFYMDNCCKPRHKTELIGWLIDPAELYPDTSDGLIRIVIQDNGIVAEYIKELQFGKNIEIGILTNSYYENLITNQITVLDNYKLRYDIIRKTDIFIITSNIFDRELLYSFAMCDTMIVTDENFIDPKIVDDLNLIFYDSDTNDFPLNDIINRLDGFQSRHKIMSSNLNHIDCAITKIINWLELNDKNIYEYNTLEDDSTINISDDNQLISETSEKYEYDDEYNDIQLNIINEPNKLVEKIGIIDTKKTKRKQLIQSRLRLAKI